MIEERAVVFDRDDARLLGIVSVPAVAPRKGVLVVVGGPQYRAGSHRQFTLLCRALAKEGIAAMRFDCRGMGDSEGDPQSFEDSGPDISAAIDELFRVLPSLVELTIWGLCDAASAAVLYAHADPRVKHLVLLNPWVRDSVTLARTTLKHYYQSRLADPEFWRKLARGEVAVGRAVRSFVATIGTAMSRTGAKEDAAEQAPRAASATAHASLSERMREDLARFKGGVLLILSGRDLTASEFSEVARASSAWRNLMGQSRIERRELPEADHTFSRRVWSEQVARWTAEWVGLS